MMPTEKTLKIPSYNVLVVDDEEPVRKLVATLMSRRGHQCLQTTDGVEALAKAKAIGFDAIITDIVMPKMDGISLIKEVLMISPDNSIGMVGNNQKEAKWGAIGRSIPSQTTT